VPKIPLPLPVLVVSRLKLHRAGRERRAGAKIMPAVRKALEKARRTFRLSNLDREGLPA
jgi:hypothetical protein